MDNSLVDVDQRAVEAIQDKKKEPKWSKPFPVIGKGTLFFNVKRSSPFYLVVRKGEDKLEKESWIGLNVGEKRVSLLSKKPKYPVETLKKVVTSDFFGDNVGIEPDTMCTYWLSYDSDRMVVKYGKGYCMEKTTILTETFKQNQENEDAFFDPTVRRKVELYDQLMIMSGIINFIALADVEPEVDFDPSPLVSDRQPLVKDSSKANLFDLDDDKFTYSSSLPSACQTLYGNIIGVDVHLDFVHPDVHHYDFTLSDAIRYSFETPGCVLNKKIKEKDGQFAYLRVTLGNEFGNSPGVPYVLELWPKSHGSPVHNHGNAYAVIRVLHGGLTIHYYNKLSESTTDDGKCRKDDPNLGLKPLGNLDVEKGHVTWISPRWYQTHRLQNDTDDYCATINCYAYGTNDNMHWPYFDYLKSCKTIAESKPYSDFRFKEMYDLVMEEYSNKRNPQQKKTRKRKRK
jgi:hypothetical protein